MSVIEMRDSLVASLPQNVYKLFDEDIYLDCSKKD